MIKIMNIQEENKTFEQCLNETDAEVQIKFRYLDELLSDIEDERYDLYESIIKTDVDEEITRMLSDGKIDLIASIDKSKMKKELDRLDLKYDVVEYLFEEAMFEILQ